MEIFETKYNYLVLALRVLFFLFVIALFIGFATFVIPKAINGRQFGFKSILGMIAATFLLVFLFLRFLKLLINQRNILTFGADHLRVIDAVFKNEKIINNSDIKGFSLSRYPTRFWNFKEVVIYLTNGKKIELPQFLYWNYKKYKT